MTVLLFALVNLVHLPYASIVGFCTGPASAARLPAWSEQFINGIGFDCIDSQTTTIQVGLAFEFQIILRDNRIEILPRQPGVEFACDIRVTAHPALPVFLTKDIGANPTLHTADAGSHL